MTRRPDHRTTLKYAKDAKRTAGRLQKTSEKKEHDRYQAPSLCARTVAATLQTPLEPVPTIVWMPLDCCCFVLFKLYDRTYCTKHVLFCPKDSSEAAPLPPSREHKKMCLSHDRRGIRVCSSSSRPSRPSLRPPARSSARIKKTAGSRGELQ